MSEPKFTGYRIHNIFLLESNFKREVDIPFDDSHNFIPKLEIISDEPDEVIDSNNYFYLTSVTTFSWTHKDIQLLEIEIKMTGIFEKVGDTQVSISDFKKVNAPAIIFPFTREHVSSLCTKAGIGNILLPPVNFKN
jgi:preprotein translocase subunit SecB